MADSGTQLRTALSFGAIFLGWCVAYGWFVADQVHGPGFGYVTDFEFMLIWPATFVLVGWLLTVVPLVRWGDHGHWMFAPRWAPLVGGLSGMLVFAVLLSPFGWAGITNPRLVAFAGTVGLVGWTAYTVAVHSQQVWRWAVRYPGLPWLLYALPPALVLAFSLVTWPLLERATPALAYHYGGPEARIRIAKRAFAAIKVGDRVEDVQRRLPSLLAAPTHDQVVRVTGNLGGACYTLEIREERVTRVVFEDPCQGLGRARPPSS